MKWLGIILLGEGNDLFLCYCCVSKVKRVSYLEIFEIIHECVILLRGNVIILFKKRVTLLSLRHHRQSFFPFCTFIPLSLLWRTSPYTIFYHKFLSPPTFL